MMAEEAISLVVAVLDVARAANILKCDAARRRARVRQPGRHAHRLLWDAYARPQGRASRRTRLRSRLSRPRLAMLRSTLAGSTHPITTPHNDASGVSQIAGTGTFATCVDQGELRTEVVGAADMRARSVTSGLYAAIPLIPKGHRAVGTDRGRRHSR
jgi:hypothetical protein